MTSPGPPPRRRAEIRTCGRVRPPLIIPEGQGSSVPDYRKINHFEAIFELSDIGARFNQFTQLPPQEMLARASAVLPPWISVLLVVAIAWQLANIVWLLVPSDVDTVTTAPSAQGRATLAESAGGADIQAIVNAHLFGDYNAVEAVVEAEPVDAPDTNLSLELRGTIVAESPEEALAIIAEKGGDEHVYAIGEAVPGNASLHSVHPDRVLLRRAGRLEALRLPRADEGARGGRTASSRRQVSTPRATSSLRELVNRDPARITDVIRPQPVFRDGQQQGYRVYPGRERQQFSALGLRPGDLVTQINGMSLDDPARGMEIFRGLGDATQVSVTIERNGQTEVLTLDTSRLQASEDASPRASSRDEDR
jgi:general secretion pathway protein C